MPFVPATITGLREIGNLGAQAGGGVIPVYNYIANATSMDISLQRIAWSLSAQSGTEVDVGSFMTVLRCQAQAINDMATMQSDMLTAHQAIATNLTTLASVLTGISGHLAAAVTTQQVAVADQIKNNKFQQVTTNAALKRSDLPETEVPSSTVLETFQQTTKDTLTFKGQIAGANLVQTGITESFAYGQTLATQYLKDTFVGAWGNNVKNFFKGFIKTTETETETKKKTLEANATKRGASLLYVPPPSTP